MIVFSPAITTAGLKSNDGKMCKINYGLNCNLASELMNSFISH